MAITIYTSDNTEEMPDSTTEEIKNKSLYEQTISSQRKELHTTIITKDSKDKLSFDDYPGYE